MTEAEKNDHLRALLASDVWRECVRPVFEALRDQNRAACADTTFSADTAGLSSLARCQERARVFALLAERPETLFFAPEPVEVPMRRPAGMGRT